MLRSSVGALVVVALAGVAEAQPRTASQVLADVQRTYAAATAMTAVFEQEVTNVTFGTTRTVSGQIHVKRPGRIRWTYDATPRKGQPARTATSFILDDRLVPMAVGFLSGTPTWAADVRATFDTTGTYGAAGDHVVLLTPKTPSAAYKKLYLVVDPSTSQVRESILVDTAGNVNRFSFPRVNLAAALRDELFEVDRKTPARP